MSAFKSAVPYKNGAFLLLLIIILLLVLISRNSHALVRAWVAQRLAGKLPISCRRIVSIFRLDIQW